MLEIILLFYFSKKIGVLAEEKGYRKGQYIFMFVSLWLVGEIAGLYAGAMISQGILVYVMALLGAALGAAISFRIVHGLDPITKIE